MALEMLPHALLQSILFRLDVPSICAAAAACRCLHFCASQVLPHLQSFHLLEIAPSYDGLKHLLSCNLTLQSLRLDCSNLDDAALECILKPQLQELYLENCDHFSANLLVEIGQHCTDLRLLSLELGWQADSQEVGSCSTGLEQLLRSCSLLESLSLKCEGSCFDSHTYAAIPSLVAPSLKYLDLGYAFERDAKQLFNLNVPQIASHRQGQRTYSFANLEKLCLVLDRITDSLVMTISKNLLCLTDLDLRDEPSEEPLVAFDLTNWGVQEIGSCSMLRRLSLVRSQDWYPASFRRVNDLGILLMAEKCTNMESIRLGGFSRITDAGCRAILHSCVNLHVFELLQTSQLTDLAFLDLPATPLTLISVSLASCTLISDCSLIHLAYCRDLEVLNLKGCRSVGDGGLKAISGLCRLKTLVLNGSDISDAGLSILGKGFAPLVQLSLRGCQRVSDHGITALVDGLIVQTLEDLDLSSIASLTDNAILALVRSGMQIIELRLRDCPLIGDTSVMALASMTFKGRGFGGTLRLLDLWNCRCISLLSAGWFRKPYFPRLRWLGIGWNLLSQTILDTLRKERPSMRIIWHGNELDRYVSEDFDELGKSYYEEEDELERWLMDGDR
eukprot:c28432_g1_i3 orf=347-2197(+)